MVTKKKKPAKSRIDYKVYSVTFSNEITIEIAAQSSNEVRRALPEALQELEEGYWNTPGWKYDGVHGPVIGGVPDHGVVREKIVAYQDYKRYLDEENRILEQANWADWEREAWDHGWRPDPLKDSDYYCGSGKKKWG